MTEDGQVAGAGYCATEKGCALINPCDICGKRALYEYDGKRECFEHYSQSTIQEPLPLPVSTSATR